MMVDWKVFWINVVGFILGIVGSVALIEFLKWRQHLCNRKLFNMMFKELLESDKRIKEKLKKKKKKK